LAEHVVKSHGYAYLNCFYSCHAFLRTQNTFLPFNKEKSKITSKQINVGEEDLKKKSIMIVKEKKSRNQQQQAS
jgi:hypothetical protein